MIQYIVNTKYNIETGENEEFVTIFSDHFDQPLVATSGNSAEYSEIIALLKDESRGYEVDKAKRIEELVDMSNAVSDEFNKVTERVSINNGLVYFDGDIVDNSVTNQIIRFLKNGDDFAPLAKFLEKLYQNPNAHSRNQLYDWLNARDFTITSDGDIYAYKGVRADGKSIHSGGAIVDGTRISGSVPNEVGSTIEMARSEVQFDPGVGCSTGLHVGTYDYAESFGSKVLGVIVSPRDIVSVPTDSGAQKVRTCRYKVIDVVSKSWGKPYYENDDVIDYDESDKYEEYEEDYYEDEDEECPCGDPDCPGFQW